VFVGTLNEVGETQVGLVDGDVGKVWIAWDDIVKATAEYEFPVPGSKKKGIPR